MQVKSIADCFIKLPFVIKIFVLASLHVGFTVPEYVYQEANTMNYDQPAPTC